MLPNCFPKGLSDQMILSPVAHAHQLCFLLDETTGAQLCLLKGRKFKLKQELSGMIFRCFFSFGPSIFTHMGQGGNFRRPRVQERPGSKQD